MNVKKDTLATAVGLVLGGASMSTHAALTSAAILILESGIGFCKSGGTYPDCFYGSTGVTQGSWFSLDTNGDGHRLTERVPITAIGGVFSVATDHMGPGLAIHETFDNTGNPIGSHPGMMTGAENPQFDIWEFFGNVGLDYLRSPMINLGTSGGGAVHIIDMSGYTVSWNGIPAIPMGGDTLNFAVDTQRGTMTCSNSTCSFSSTFALDYDAHVPLGDVSGFGGVAYRLHLVGEVGHGPTTTTTVAPPTTTTAATTTTTVAPPTTTTAVTTTTTVAPPTTTTVAPTTTTAATTTTTLPGGDSDSDSDSSDSDSGDSDNSDSDSSDSGDSSDSDSGDSSDS